MAELMIRVEIEKINGKSLDGLIFPMPVLTGMTIRGIHYTVKWSLKIIKWRIHLLLKDS